MPDAPALTYSLRFHARGAKESRRIEEILADGQPTGITLHTTTRRPGYDITRRELQFEDEVLDLQAGNPDAIAWIRARLRQPADAS